MKQVEEPRERQKGSSGRINEHHPPVPSASSDALTRLCRPSDPDEPRERPPAGTPDRHTMWVIAPSYAAPAPCARAPLQRHGSLLCPSQVHATPPPPTRLQVLPQLPGGRGPSGACLGQELGQPELTERTGHPRAWIVKSAK